MRLLLDTHTLIWWTLDDPCIPKKVHDAIVDATNVKLVSAATAVELATKVRIGKLPEAAHLAMNLEEVLEDQAFGPLSITARHGQRAGLMPGSHKDPFDRMLAAQALIDGLTIVSSDAALDQFGVQRLW